MAGNHGWQIEAPIRPNVGRQEERESVTDTLVPERNASFPSDFTTSALKHTNHPLDCQFQRTTHRQLTTASYSWDISCTVNKTKIPFQFCTMFKQIQTTTQEDCREGSAFRWYFYIIIAHVVFKLTKAELAIGTWVSNRNRVEGKLLARAASRVCTPLTRIATNSIIPTNGYCAQRVKNT